MAPGGGCSECLECRLAAVTHWREEADRLRGLNDGLASRLAAASEVIAACAVREAARAGPVGERMPADGQDVLFWTKATANAPGMWNSGTYDAAGGRFNGDGRTLYFIEEVTHWREMPPAPSREALSASPPGDSPRE
jgi:hypothetical protein